MKVELLGVRRILSHSFSAFGVASDVQKLTLTMVVSLMLMDFWESAEKLE